METVLIDGGTITVLPENVLVMTRVHTPSVCAGRTCMIHNPTDHPMRSWPIHWRDDRGLFERICEHRVGHPDPDQQDYWREQAERGEIRDEVLDDEFGFVENVRTPDQHVATQMDHTCDGCCNP